MRKTIETIPEETSMMAEDDQPIGWECVDETKNDATLDEVRLRQ